jgi:hypothetical protein
MSCTFIDIEELEENEEAIVVLRSVPPLVKWRSRLEFSKQ